MGDAIPCLAALRGAVDLALKRMVAMFPPLPWGSV